MSVACYPYREKKGGEVESLRKKLGRWGQNISTAWLIGLHILAPTMPCVSRSPSPIILFLFCCPFSFHVDILSSLRRACRILLYKALFDMGDRPFLPTRSHCTVIYTISISSNSHITDNDGETFQVILHS